jgi:hypothetical protein
MKFDTCPGVTASTNAIAAMGQNVAERDHSTPSRFNCRRQAVASCISARVNLGSSFSSKSANDAWL